MCHKWSEILKSLAPAARGYLLIISELTNQSARKALSTCMEYTITRYGVYHLLRRPWLTCIYHVYI